MTKMNNWEKELSNLLTKMSEHYLIDDEFEKELKWFITNALNQQRESLIKEIREIKVPPYPAEGPQASIMTNMARMGYQDAIIDILTKLEEEK